MHELPSTMYVVTVAIYFYNIDRPETDHSLALYIYTVPYQKSRTTCGLANSSVGHKFLYLAQNLVDLNKTKFILFLEILAINHIFF